MKYRQTCDPDETFTGYQCSIILSVYLTVYLYLFLCLSIHLSHVIYTQSLGLFYYEQYFLVVSMSAIFLTNNQCPLFQRCLLYLYLARAAMFSLSFALLSAIFFYELFSLQFLSYSLVITIRFYILRAVQCSSFLRSQLLPVVVCRKGSGRY